MRVTVGVWMSFVILAVISLPGAAAPASAFGLQSSAGESGKPRVADSASPSESPRAAVERLVADYVEIIGKRSWVFGKVR